MHCFYSNRTLTAKFSQSGKTFHFIVKGDGWLNWWGGDRDESFSVTFTRDELGNNRDYNIIPEASSGWLLSGDEWEVNGTTYLADQYGEFYVTSSLYDKYPDNTTFCYNFINKSMKTCTVTVISSTWSSNKWHDQAGGMVGFDRNPTLIQTKKTVSYGESVTIYASGKSGNSDSDYGTAPWWYYINGFYNSSHVPYKAFSGNINTMNDSYTFKPQSDTTIYVDFIYYKR